MNKNSFDQVSRVQVKTVFQMKQDLRESREKITKIFLLPSKHLEPPVEGNTLHCTKSIQNKTKIVQWRLLPTLINTDKKEVCSNCDCTKYPFLASPTSGSKTGILRNTGAT